MLWDYRLGEEPCQPGCVPRTGLGHHQAHRSPEWAPSGEPCASRSGTRANPWQHGDPSLSRGPSRDSTGGAPGRQAPFTAPRHRALSLPTASHAVPWAPGIPAGTGRGWLAEGPGVATGPVHLLDRVSSTASGCLTALQSGEMLLCIPTACPCMGQGEGRLHWGLGATSLCPSLSPATWTAQRDLSLLCCG